MLQQKDSVNDNINYVEIIIEPPQLVTSKAIKHNT